MRDSSTTQAINDGVRGTDKCARVRVVCFCVFQVHFGLACTRNDNDQVLGAGLCVCACVFGGDCVWNYSITVNLRYDGCIVEWFGIVI